MKLLIASDIHGDFESAKALINVFLNDKCDKILLLGDVLYHGPRNDLPPTYSPKDVITLLNNYKDVILCVRGNCDTEVDQMVLAFPILGDYALLSLDGITVYATHGHKYNTLSAPPLSNGDILLHGHTHVLCSTAFGNNHYLNPGSIALPKENNPRTYMIYENRCFSVFDLNNNLIFEKKF